MHGIDSICVKNEWRNQAMWVTTLALSVSYVACTNNKYLEDRVFLVCSEATRSLELCHLYCVFLDSKWWNDNNPLHIPFIIFQYNSISVLFVNKSHPKGLISASVSIGIGAKDGEKVIWTKKLVVSVLGTWFSGRVLTQQIQDPRFKHQH